LETNKSKISKRKWKMNYKKVFIDANIFIDLFDTDRPLRKYSIEAIQKLLEENVELYTSCDLITTIYYVLRKKFGRQALIFIEKLSKICELLPFSNKDLDEAITLMKKNFNFKDLEDTLQYVLAKKMGCDLILSNDKKFYSPDIEVLNTKDFLKKLEE